MGHKIRIKKGLNIKLAGEAAREIIDIPIPDTVVVKPTDFIGVVPGLLVQQGDEVKAGTPLFYDKKNEKVKFCSPVSGEIAEIVRGDKRKILELKILADKEIKYSSFDTIPVPNSDSNAIIERLLNSGVWPLIRQRPFGIIPNPEIKPKSIFISAFDSNPLAPDIDFIMKGNEVDFQAGIDALSELTDGKIHINVRADQPSTFFTSSKNAEINYISGPHPAGNVGVQIHHIDPVNKGEVVWCIQPQDVVIIGRLLNYGKFDTSKVVALAGSGVLNPRYYRTIIGSSVKNIIGDAELKDGEQRIISGNVLTGTQISADGYLGFYDNQITVIEEGNEPEFLGWIKPGFKKYSMSRAFFSWLTPNKVHTLDTNLHGEERPFVVSGQYEQVLPMDIYPVHLLKSILVEDIELMEKLGIYEVVEEDFALCEFICTSKIESQSIIRRGLDLVRKESA